jgi:drug/metabolite transporter (DMT)-like permease
LNQRKENLRSIYAMLAAVGFFALMDTVLKLLSQHYPAIQVAALRCLASMPLIMVYIAYRGALPTLFKIRWSMHILRTVLGIAMLALFAYGIRHLSLAESYTIFFIAPGLITALSVFFLGEKVDAARWAAIVVGMLGVIVVLRPSGTGFLSIGGLAIVGAAVCYAISAIAARVTARTDSAEQMIFWLMFLSAIGATALALPDWVALRKEDTWLLVALAITGFFGQIAITKAFGSGEASVVAPFEYTALAWGVAIDWLLWHTLPDHYTIIGATIIIGSGIYLIRHEKIHAESEHP